MTNSNQPTEYQQRNASRGHVIPSRLPQSKWWWNDIEFTVRSSLFIIVLICCASTSNAASNLLCNDASWNIVGGDWSYDSSDCSLTNNATTSENFIWFGSADGFTPDAEYQHSRFTLTAVFTVHSGDNYRVGVCFRAEQAVSPTQWYQAYLTRRLNYVTFAKYVNDVWGNVGRTKFFPQFTTYVLKVVAKGSLYDVYVNDTLMLSKSHKKFINGSIGLRAAATLATFHSLSYSATADNYTIIAVTEDLTENQVVLVVKDSLQLTGDNIYSSTATPTNVTVLVAIPSDRELETDEIRRIVEEAMVDEYPDATVESIIVITDEEDDEFEQEETNHVIIPIVVVVSVLICVAVLAAFVWVILKKRRQTEKDTKQDEVASRSDNATGTEPGAATQDTAISRGVDNHNEEVINAGNVKGHSYQYSMTDSNQLYVHHDPDDIVTQTGGNTTAGIATGGATYTQWSP